MDDVSQGESGCVRSVCAMLSVRRVRPAAALCAALVGLALLTACASQQKKNDQELEELLQLLPGHYDNTAQVQSDVAKAVQPPHEALAIDIVEIDAPMIGHHVFYLQENIAGNPLRVTDQRLLMFDVVNKEIVQTSLLLSEANRWRNGQRNPDLFKSILPTDVRSMKGCSLRWKKEEGHFTGANEPKTCHSGARGAAGAVARVEYRAELGPDEYATAELAYDLAGRLVRGRQDEPFYRFRRQSRDAIEGESSMTSD